MDVTSPAFRENKPIPSRFAMPGVRGGANISPPLCWVNKPPGTQSFVLLMIDLHPEVYHWIHWSVINIPFTINFFPAGVSPSGLPVEAIELYNSLGSKGYAGPQPPPGSGIHKYLITVYALNVVTLHISPYTSYPILMEHLAERVISSGSLTGIFER